MKDKGTPMKSVIICAVIAFTSITFAKQVAINSKASTIEWTGQKKVPGGDHNGVVQIKKGTVNFDKSMTLTGGTLVIDMTSIEDKDLTGKWKKKLEDHLNSEDFFDVKNNKEASFKITKVTTTRSNLVKVTGNLTLRGKTHSETFEVAIGKKGNVMTASGSIEFDRNKYGVTYNSEASVLKKAIKLAKDKIIKDKIKLDINLQTEKI